MIGLTYIMQLENVTNKQLSEHLGITPSTISQWGSGNRPIPADKVDRLSEIFPAYDKSYFQKTINRDDTLDLQNMLYKYQRSLLNDKNDWESLKTRRALANKLEYNKILAEQREISGKVTEMFVKMQQLKMDDEQKIMVKRLLTDNLNAFLKIQEEMVRALMISEEHPSVQYKQALKNTNIRQDFKDFVNMVKDTINSLENIL